MILALPVLALTLRAAAAAPKKAGDPLATSVVSSDEWRIRRAPAKEEEFIGNVRYRARSNFLRADWALYKHGDKTWRARGDIRAEHRFANGDRFEAHGENALFDAKTEKGELTGKKGLPVSFLRTPETGDPDLGEAGRFEWQGKRRFDLVSTVHFWGPRFEAWADHARLEAETRTATLTGGRPVLRDTEPGWSGAVKADEIVASEGLEHSRRVQASGQVKGWIEYKKQAGKASEY